MAVPRGMAFFIPDHQTLCHFTFLEIPMFKDQPSTKQLRALFYLMHRDVMSVEHMADMLGIPTSTMAKPRAAFLRLTGQLGKYLQDEAVSVVCDVKLGRSQVDAARGFTDHKMVSDLVAMAWACQAHCSTKGIVFDGEEQARAKVIERKLKVKLQAKVDELTAAFDDLLATSPDGNAAYAISVDRLTKAVQALEDYAG